MKKEYFQIIQNSTIFPSLGNNELEELSELITEHKYVSDHSRALSCDVMVIVKYKNYLEA